MNMGSVGVLKILKNSGFEKNEEVFGKLWELVKKKLFYFRNHTKPEEIMTNP